MKSRDLRASWPQALRSFLIPVLIVLISRWLLIEPYVIPSGSMIPTFLIHDHIFVNKLAYGIRFPFSKSWLLRWSSPQRGDVIVFFYPENPELFFVKRVIGVGGDRIVLKGREVMVNGRALARDLLPQPENNEEYDLMVEEGHWVRYMRSTATSGESDIQEIKVPAHSLFVMGDNRDESNDSRYWGFVPENHVLGKATMIWLSCEETLPSAPFLCDPAQIRWSRILTFVHERVSL